MEWHQVTFTLLSRLLGRGWRWEKKGARLRLVSPRGSRWDFKLQGKPWLRKTTS